MTHCGEGCDAEELPMMQFGVKIVEHQAVKNMVRSIRVANKVLKII